MANTWIIEDVAGERLTTCRSVDFDQWELYDRFVRHGSHGEPLFVYDHTNLSTGVSRDEAFLGSISWDSERGCVAFEVNPDA